MKTEQEFWDECVLAAMAATSGGINEPKHICRSILEITTILTKTRKDRIDKARTRPNKCGRARKAIKEGK